MVAPSTISLAVANSFQRRHGTPGWFADHDVRVADLFGAGECPRVGLSWNHRGEAITDSDCSAGKSAAEAGSGKGAADVVGQQLRPFSKLF